MYIYLVMYFINILLYVSHIWQVFHCFYFYRK